MSFFIKCVNEKEAIEHEPIELDKEVIVIYGHLSCNCGVTFFYNANTKQWIGSCQKCLFDKNIICNIFKEGMK